MAELDVASVLHMLNAHEDRIQRLEDLTTELVGTVSEQNATLKAFSMQMQMMTESVVEKLDQGMRRINHQLGEMKDISKELVKDNKAADKRIDALERQDDRADKVFDWKLKLKYAVFTAVGGAALTLLTQFLMRYVGK